MKSSRKSSSAIRKSLLQLWRKALRKADPGSAVKTAILEKRGLLWPGIGGALPKKIRLVAVGKSAGRMAEGAYHVLGRRISEALVIVPRSGASPKLRGRARMFIGDHPIPTHRSFLAGRRLLSFVQEDDLTPILFLISGGASSLAAVPKNGWSESRKAREIRRRLFSGHDIFKLNRFRIRVSAIKGGKILQGVHAPIASLIVSDVIGDPLDVIASGLTYPTRRMPNVRNHLILSCASAADTVARVAKSQQMKVQIRKSPISGDAQKAGYEWGKWLPKSSGQLLFVSHGETTVRVQGRGKGGRNLEFAAGAARALEGRDGIVVLSIATDGVDGSSSAAGAFVDSTTLDRARRNKIPFSKLLRAHDSEAIFRKLGDLVRTGPTGRNFADLQIAWIDGQR